MFVKRSSSSEEGVGVTFPGPEFRHPQCWDASDSGNMRLQDQAQRRKFIGVGCLAFLLRPRDIGRACVCNRMALETLLRVTQWQQFPHCILSKKGNFHSLPPLHFFSGPIHQLVFGKQTMETSRRILLCEDGRCSVRRRERETRSCRV